MSPPTGTLPCFITPLDTLVISVYPPLTLTLPDGLHEGWKPVLCWPPSQEPPQIVGHVVQGESGPLRGLWYLNLHGIQGAPDAAPCVGPIGVATPRCSVSHPWYTPCMGSLPPHLPPRPGDSRGRVWPCSRRASLLVSVPNLSMRFARSGQKDNRGPYPTKDNQGTFHHGSHL